MATFHHNHNHHQLSPTRPRKVCFSFAAYAKTVIAALKSSDVHVSAGLTDDEITAVETTGGFTFPPDLRAILSEGLPMGPGFPNWRSSSPHQLRLLTSLPTLSLCKEASRSNFWVPSWGPRPKNKDEAHLMAQQFLAQAPPLVPVFRHCYIPGEPKLAGNPVFYVHGGDVRLASADVGGFFRETEFGDEDWAWRQPRRVKNVAPAWAKEARRVKFWSDLAAREVNYMGWWSGELSGCIEQVMWKLRDGGWAEEDVREMMMMNGCDEAVTSTCGDVSGVKQVRKLSRELLKSGWNSNNSVDYVVYSFSDCGEDENETTETESGGSGESGRVVMLQGEALVEFHCLSSSSNSFDSVISCN